MAFTPGTEQSIAVRVQSEGVDEFTGRMDSAIGSLGAFQAAVGAAGAALSAMAAGALVSAVNEARNFEQAMVEVNRVTNPEVAAELSDEIRNMAETIPLAQDELASLTADAARFGIEGTENIRTFTETTARMAVATNLNSQEAGEALARLGTLTETPVEEMENLGSTINSLGNNFATSSQEVVDSMLRSSAALSQFGLNNTQIAGMSAALNEVSESSQRAGTRLRRVGQELMNPSNVEDLSNALGMTASEFETMREESPNELLMQMVEAFEQGGESADQLRTSLSTASRQAIAGLAQNSEGLNDALSVSNESYDEASSLQEEFEATTETLNAQLQLLGNQLRNSAIEVGNVFLPSITDAVQSLREFLDSNQTVISQLSAQQRAWGLVATAIGGAALAVGVFLSGPVGLLIAGLGALGAAWATNFGDIRGITQDVLTEVEAEFDRVLGIVEPVARSTVEDIREAWDQNGDELVSRTRAHLDTLVSVFQSGLSFLLDSFIVPTLDRLTDVYEAHMSGLVDETVATADVLLSHVDTLTTELSAFWDDWGDEITAVAEFVLDILSTVLVTRLDAVFTMVRASLAALRGDWSAAFELIEEFTDRSAERVRDTLESVPMFEGLLSGLQSAQSSSESFADTFTAGVENAATTAREAFNRIRSVVVPVMRFIANTLIVPLVRRIRNVWDRHFPAIRRETVETFNAVRNRVQTVLDFIAPYVTEVLQFVTGTFRTHLGNLQTAVAVGLGLIQQGWELFGDEILLVVEFLADGVIGLVGTMFDGLLTAFRVGLALIRGDWGDAWDLMAQFGENVLDGFVDFVVEWGPTLATELYDAIEWAGDEAIGAVDSFVESVESTLESIGTGLGDALAMQINDALGLPFEHTIGQVEVQGETVFAGETISIPALAEGGIVTSPTLAMVGEGRQDEAVIPLDQIGQIAGERGAAQGGEGPREIVVRLMGEGEITSALADTAEVTVDEQRRTTERLAGRPDNV